MPLIPLIHITAAYSNAVLVAIMPQISDFSKKLGLPLPQPIPLNQVQEFKLSPMKDSIRGSVIITNEFNSFWFSYGNGAVNGFRIDHVPFLDEDPANNWKKYAFGKSNMTTNDAIEMARSALEKLGYSPKDFNADISPKSLQGPYDFKDGNHVPYCEIQWMTPTPTNLEEQRNGSYLFFYINMEKKSLMGMTIINRKIWKDEPHVDAQPELEKDYQKRMQGKMFIDTNAPARMHMN